MLPIFLFQMLKKEDDRTELLSSFNFPKRMKLYNSNISGVEVKSKKKMGKKDSFRRLLRPGARKIIFSGFWCFVIYG